ncbi:hypothetical protein LR48_Vigan08g049400 [Vigna angularis]|uniref:Uncharacterized protein n=1 Tax=Phaseolus angularis TaxID=3914 RepID=A0A0L9V408_PHAAN|nr:hypothetical protein LR48_Vigan08g049400 [Vigna angularis]
MAICINCHTRALRRGRGVTPVQEAWCRRHRQGAAPGSFEWEGYMNESKVGSSIRVELWWDEGLVVGGGFVVRRRWREEATMLRKGSLVRSVRWRFGTALGLDE